MFRSNVYVHEVHRKKIIPFPSDLWKSNHSLPHKEELFLAFVAAAMLFSYSEEDFSGYMAQEINRIFSEFEGSQQGNHEEAGSAMMRLAEDFFGSWTAYLYYTRWKGFTKQGKGSLDERIMQGRICGAVYMTQELSGKTLKDSIEAAIPLFNEIKSDPALGGHLPTLSFDNIQNSIWPKFKSSAWLWAAFFCSTTSYRNQRIPFEEIQIHENIFSDIGALRQGWRGFIDYALRFYSLARDNEKRAGESPPADGEIWRFSFQMESS